MGYLDINDVVRVLVIIEIKFNDVFVGKSFFIIWKGMLLFVRYRTEVEIKAE